MWADREVRIIGSKTNLLQMLTAAAGVNPATAGVPSFGPKVAEGVGFEPTREREPPAGFQDRCLKPLGHPSSCRIPIRTSEAKSTRKPMILVTLFNLTCEPSLPRLR